MESLNSQYGELKRSLKDHDGAILAVDIDETLSATNSFWITELAKLLGIPEGIGIDDLVNSYGRASQVPFWDPQKVEDFIVRNIADSRSVLSYPVIPGTLDGVITIEHLVGMYLTTRPDGSQQVTELWLKSQGFPQRPVMCMPSKEWENPTNRRNGIEWKANVLNFLYPEISGVIDDNQELVDELLPHYQGTVYLFSDGKASQEGVVQFSSWQELTEVLA